MKIVRWMLLSLTFFLLMGLASQARYGPQVEVVIDRHDFTPHEVDRLAYLFKARAHRRSFEIDFHFSSHSSHYRDRHRGRGRGRYQGRFNNRFDGGYDDRHFDFRVRLDARQGYYDRCGRYREHYDWYVVDPYDRVIKRGHAHHYDRVARDVVKVVYRQWR